MDNLTGVVVSYNTVDLLSKALHSIWDFYPDLRVIIVDGSDVDNPCYKYVKELDDPNVFKIQPGYNIGHGRGMAMGIAMAETDYVLLFDSDIEMKDAPIEKMLDLFEADTFGVGEIVNVPQSTYGVKIGDGSDVPCLHPYFHIISKKQYSQYLPYVHSGGPTALTAIDIYRRGLSKVILKSFPVRDYVRHDWRGTRDLNPEDFNKGNTKIADYFPQKTDSMITVVMIDSRSDIHPDWVQTAINSVKAQTYPVKLLVVNNVGRKKTIGQCWNEAVKQISTPWTFFLGDDDWISRDYLYALASFASDPRMNGIVSISTPMTVFREDGKDAYKHLHRPCTGMWRTDYLKKYPFNEKLQKGIDREYVEETEKRGDPKIMIHYHSGYHYRQHEDYSCAGKISFKKKAGDVYVNSRYPIHAALITERLKKHFSMTMDNHPFEPETARGAKVLFCDWGNENAVAIGNYETDAKKILRIHAYEAFTGMIHYIPFDNYEKVIFVAEHIKEYVERQLNRKLEHAVVIPNAVDLKAFYPPENKERNNKIAYAGELSRKKGVQLLLVIAEHFPEYAFHVAGKFSERDMAEYFQKRQPDNVFLEPYSYDLNEFFKDKTYFLLTSPREGCNVTTLQAMAAGLSPIVYDHVGAGNIFPRRNLFKHINDVKYLLDDPLDVKTCRYFIEDKYNIEKIFPQYLEIIKNLLEQSNENGQRITHKRELHASV